MKNLLLTGLILFTYCLNFAQESNCEDKVLSTYTDATVTARNSVILKPGFSTDGKNLHVYIDADMPCGYEDPTAQGHFNMNFIRITTPIKDKDTVAVPAQADIDYSEWHQEVQYFDGLGRPVQNVSVKASPEGRDMIQPVEYDEFGRRAKEHLPYYVHQQGELAGAYRPGALSVNDSEQAYFYDHFFDQGDAAYAEKTFDNSPLNRVMSQAAPGVEFNKSSGKTVDYEYTTNTSGEVKLFKINSEGDLIADGYYEQAQLYKTVTNDENQKETAEYKNLLGQTILTVADYGGENLSTYYVYDDFGLLRYVISPKATEQISDGTYVRPTESTGSSILKELCYYYEYDGRKRQIIKKLPGAEPVYIVYDKRDLPILTQDGNQREKNQWMFTKYDAFKRPIISGTYTDDVHTSLSNMQGYYNAVWPAENWETYDAQADAYTNNAFPDLSDTDFRCTLLSRTYYDSYDYLDKFNGEYDFVEVFGSADPNVKGMTTITETAVLDESLDFLITVNYYDQYGRVIQTVADNHLGGWDRISNRYNFSGELLETKEEHSVPDKAQRTLRKYFEYDRMSRLIKEEEKAETDTERTLISQNSYTELGELQSKSLHQKTDGSFLQTVDYQYNIRGWMTHINDPLQLGKDLFGMRIDYTSGNNPQYNGNISALHWNTGSGSTGYDYDYDGSNRILTADYSDAAKYSTSYGYDANGNILNLTRSGLATNPDFTKEYALTDDLKYTYIGNQVMEIYDREHAVVAEGDFDDGARDQQEYFYDANGNMIKDSNKGITEIQYNFLNLPKKIVLTDTDGDSEIRYIYDAAGVKLAKITVGKDSETTRTEYAGSYVYKDKTLDYQIFSEGRKIFNNGTWQYEYHLKDHLGNVRVAFDETDSVRQENHYYPFGLRIADLGLQNSDNKYLYNGKEMQDDFGLDWLDYGARFYDAEIGRWHVVDRMSEKYISQSPYHFSGNNPILFVDDNGMNYDDYFDENGNYLHTDNKTTDNIKVINSADWKFISMFYRSELKDTQNSHSNLTNALESNSKAIGVSNISDEAKSNIYTNIITRMDEVSASDLHNGKVSIWNGNIVTNWETYKTWPGGFNNPERYQVAGHGEDENGAHIITVGPDGHSDLTTVSNVQNALGVHELISHGFDGVPGGDYKEHAKAYKNQKAHPTWDKTTPQFKIDYNNQYNLYLTYPNMPKNDEE